MSRKLAKAAQGPSKPCPGTCKHHVCFLARLDKIPFTRAGLNSVAAGVDAVLKRAAMQAERRRRGAVTW